MAPSTTFKYNALGNLVEVENHLGRVTKHEYDKLNRRESTTLPDPDPSDMVTEHPKTVWEYDKVGNVTKITVYENATTTRVTEFEYDDLSRLVKKTLPEPDADGIDDRPVTEYVYDLVGNLVVLREKRENGTFRETSYEYDKLNRRTKVTLPDPDGAGSLPAPTTEFTYDAVGNQTEVEDHLGRITTSTYDALNRLIERKLPDPDLSDGVNRQPTTQWVYDEAGRLLELKELKDDDTFRVTTYTYDGWDRLLTETLPDPNPNDMVAENPVTTWEYDLSGNVLSVTDTLGRVTTYEYDALDRLTKETLPDPDGAGSLLAPFTETTYDNAGNVAQVEDHLGRLTVFEYDDLNRLIKETLPEPDTDGIDERPITQWTYNLLGNVLTITDPLGRVTTNEYDDLNRQTKEILPEPDADGIDDRPITEWVYDRLGNVVEVIDAMGQSTTREYDDLDRLTKEVLPDPDGGGAGVAPETVYVYDSAGNLFSEANQLGETTTYAYDRLDRLVTTTDPRSYDTDYTYDILGRQTSLTDAEGNETTFIYDDLDRLVAETNELNDTRSYEYDLLGRLESLVDRNGRLTVYVYDDLDRVTAEKWWTNSGGTLVSTISTTYNDAGLVASHTDTSGSFSYSYTYDDLDRLITRTEAGSPSITWTYTYDKAGHLTKREDTAGFTNNYYRDDLGRVVRLTQVYGGSGKMVDYEYNTLGQVTRLTRYEDLAGTTVNSFTETFYDDTHRIDQVRHRNAPGSVLRRYLYTYDSASRVLTLGNLSGTLETYTYDDAGQLTSVDYSYQTDESFSYDGTGNRTNTGYVTSDNNQTTDDGTYTYQYDDEGNRTRKTTTSTGDYVGYTWDHRNRLTKVEFHTSVGKVTKAVEYDYDHADRRIAKRVDDNADSTWDDQERFVYDGEDLTLVYDETGTPALEGRYLHGPGIDAVLAYWQPGQKIRWTWGDRLGTVRDVVEIDGSTVSTVKSQRYNSFGQITGTFGSNPGLDFRFGYTGRLWDADVSLQFNRARWYDPALGKFLSEDPLGFDAGDSNLTRYVGGDPVNFTDPSGLSADSYGPIYTLTDPGTVFNGPSRPFTNDFASQHFPTSNSFSNDFGFTGSTSSHQLVFPSQIGINRSRDWFNRPNQGFSQTGVQQLQQPSFSVFGGLTSPEVAFSLPRQQFAEIGDIGTLIPPIPYTAAQIEQREKLLKQYGRATERLEGSGQLDDREVVSELHIRRVVAEKLRELEVATNRRPGSTLARYLAQQAGLDHAFGPEPEIGFINGLGTGTKAIANAFNDSVHGIYSIGGLLPVDKIFTPIAVTQNDLGYDLAYGFARVGAEALTGYGLGTLAKGGQATSYLGRAAFALDVGGNLSYSGQGAYDIYENGLGWGNGLQTGGALLGLGGNYLGFRGQSLGGELWTPAGGFDQWLRSNGRYGRNASAWNLNRFRTNSTRFYHGTSAGFADELLADGIDLSRGRPNLDFGQGFYTTTSLSHAESMALRVAQRTADSPSIISFRVSNRQLNRLTSLTFNGPDTAWTTFVGFHRTPGASLHAFDIVSGPAVRNINTLDALPFPQFNQTSLHTYNAVSVFDNGLQRIIH